MHLDVCTEYHYLFICLFESGNSGPWLRQTDNKQLTQVRSKHPLYDERELNMMFLNPLVFFAK